MFDPEFYPTPLSVIELMGIDCYDKVVLEPSAGKGDIVDYCAGSGASLILACEKHPDLRKILSGKCQIIAEDFFNVSPEDISHVDMIIMNPPFSNADKHILHAWNIAPEGCEIIALCNYSTVSNTRGWDRSELSSIIIKYGESQNLGDCFSTAERSTNVEIGLIKIFKPVISNDFDWDGFYFTNEFERGDNSLMPYNDIRAIVNTYVAAVKCFDEVNQVGTKLNQLCGSSVFNVAFNRNETIVTREQFAREFQIKSWNKVFSKFNIQKFVTKGVMKKVNALSESRKNYPFTMKNIYRVIEIIIGTADSNMKESIVEAVDNFTRHTHENRFGVEGWKTNEGHLLNKKFIIGWLVDNNLGGDRLRIRDYNCYNYDYLIDLTKAICFITGTNYDDIISIKMASCRGVYLDKNGKEISKDNLYQAVNADNFHPNTWYDWGFFEFKVFKKGSAHFKFKDEDVWARLNQAYASVKGFTLPESVWRKAA